MSKKRIHRHHLDAQYAREIFDYHPETGLFFWKRRPESHFRKNAHWRAWNTKNEGRLISGSYDGRYYKTKLAGRLFYLHRLAFLIMTGAMPSHVDHINQIKTDNRWENLRPATALENCRNRAFDKRNTSGVCGVRFNHRLNKWNASISLMKKHITLGGHEDRFDAICARKSGELRYGFHINHGKLLAP